MNRRAIFYLILVFVLGVALGALGTHLANKWNLLRLDRRSYERVRHSRVEWLSRELSLTPEQQRQLETILDETGKQYRQVGQRMREDYEQVRQQGRERIRAILTEEQRAKFDNLLHRTDAERYRRSRDRRQLPPPTMEKKE